MDAQSEIELARTQPTGEAAAADAAVRNAGDDMDELLESIEAQLTAQEHALVADDRDFESWDFEESIRHALEGLGDEAQVAAEVSSIETDASEPVAGDMWTTAEPATVAASEPTPFADEPIASAEAPVWTSDESAWALEEQSAPHTEEPIAVVEQNVATVEETDTGPELQAVAAEAHASDDSLETVELELALHNQNLVSLGFEESIKTALAGVGGEMLFQMRLEREDCQRIAAVRIGSGEEQQFALVIMPPGGGLMRVEPVEQSSNPLAMIAESYAGLVDTLRAAA